MGRDDTKGHSQRLSSALRGLRATKLPLVSLGLAGIWLASQLAIEIVWADRLDQARAAFGHAVDYFIEHPMLRVEPRMISVLRDAMPGFEGNEVFSFLSSSAAEGAGASPQDVLDERVWNAFGLLDSHPQRRFGLVPALAEPYAYATHFLLHAGWLHMFASLVLLLLSGPVLERSFGRAPFAAMCLAIGVGSAALYAYVFPGSDRPLVGGTAVAVGLASAVVVRFRHESVDFADWLAPWLDVEMRAPAWSAALPALLVVAAISPLTDGDLPASLGVVPGYLAVGAATLLGGGMALAFVKNGIARPLPVAPRPQPTPRARAPQRLDMRRVERARKAGDLDTAFALLHAEAQRRSGNRDVVMAYWEIAVESGRAPEAVPVVFQLLREELRRGAVEIAAAHWCRVVDAVADARLESGTLARLLPWIQKVAGADRTILALEHVMQGGAEVKAELPAPLLSDIALLAAEIAPDIAQAAAELALADSGLETARRAELKELLERLAPKEDAPPSLTTPGGELPENAFYAEQDRSAFDDTLTDLGGLLPDELGNLPPVQRAGATFPGLRVAQAVPHCLEPEALVIGVAGRGEVRLAYSRICGVTIAGVGGLAPKPIVVVDLLLSGPDPDDLPLEVVRLRGDQFDPRRLVADEPAPLPALRAIVGELLKRSGGAALPSSEILDAQARVPMFESVEAYQRDVLRVRG